VSAWDSAESRSALKFSHYRTDCDCFHLDHVQNVKYNENLKRKFISKIVCVKQFLALYLYTGIICTIKSVLRSFFQKLWSLSIVGKSRPNMAKARNHDMNQGKVYLPKNIFQRKISNNRPLVGKFVSHNFMRLSLFHYEMRRCNSECLGKCKE
jgi:hypothetical protein